jgi:hypothetical protein
LDVSVPSRCGGTARFTDGDTVNRPFTRRTFKRRWRAASSRWCSDCGDDNRWVLGFFNFAPFRFLGKISYGLYLIHLFMWPLFDWLSAHYSVLRDVPPLAARFGLTVLLATAMWHLVEAPILKLKGRFQPSSFQPLRRAEI